MQDSAKRRISPWHKLSSLHIYLHLVSMQILPNSEDMVIWVHSAGEVYALHVTTRTTRVVSEEVRQWEGKRTVIEMRRHKMTLIVYRLHIPIPWAHGERRRVSQKARTAVGPNNYFPNCILHQSAVFAAPKLLIDRLLRLLVLQPAKFSKL